MPSDNRLGQLHYRTLTDVARMIEARQISPVELTEAMLRRIDAVDRELKSYATVTSSRALASAREAEEQIAAGRYRGKLHGMPIAVKDLCYTQGIRTMGGLGLLRDFVPDHDATVVSKLEGAGAVLLGKLNLTEGAMAGYHPDFDIPVNPWNASYWPGASSSGSGVAVAAGLCFAALGTDTGGSIRVPAMANGTVGLKPTYGRVSRFGVLTLGETLDHVGPLTRSTADAAAMFEAIAGHDESDATSLHEPVPNMFAKLDAGINGLKIGFDRDYTCDGADPGLVSALDEALTVLQDLGAEIVDVTFPAEPATLDEIYFAICPHETFIAHSATYPSRAEEYGKFFRDFLEIGESISDEQYAAASEKRGQYVAELNAVLESVDAIVCPAGGHSFQVSPELQYGNGTELQTLFDTLQIHTTLPASLAGTPSLTVRCGFADDGMPYALQIMGRRLSEALLCRIGHAYEGVTPWRDRHPPV